MIARKWIILVSLLSLSACAKPIPPDQEATIVAGVSITAWPKGMFGNPAFGSVSLQFQEYNPQTEELIGNIYHLSISRSRDSDCNNCKSTLYSTGKGLSGYYVLRNISVWSERSTSVTDFYKTEPSGLFGISRKAVLTGSIKGTKLLRYHFFAGETSYIGDFAIDVSTTPVRLAPMRRNDKAALSALTAAGKPINGFSYHYPTLQNPQRVNGQPRVESPIPESVFETRIQPTNP